MTIYDSNLTITNSKFENLILSFYPCFNFEKTTDDTSFIATIENIYIKNISSYFLMKLNDMNAKIINLSVENTIVWNMIDFSFVSEVISHHVALEKIYLTNNQRVLSGIVINGGKLNLSIDSLKVNENQFFLYSILFDGLSESNVTFLNSLIFSNNFNGKIISVISNKNFY